MVGVHTLLAVLPHTDVGAADSGGVNLQQDLIIIDLGNRNFFQADILGAVKTKC